MFSPPLQNKAHLDNQMIFIFSKILKSKDFLMNKGPTKGIKFWYTIFNLDMRT